MDQCNNCMSGRCVTVSRFRNKDKEPAYRIAQMLTSCTRRIAPTPFKVSMIEVAMVSSSQSVHEVLSRFNMSIVELDRKPWFKILIHKSKQRNERRPKHGNSKATGKVKRYPRSS